MVTRDQLYHGCYVHYHPSHYENDQYENGIVKAIPDPEHKAAFVVFHCGGDWKRYSDYTAALTNLEDLHLGWRP